MVYLFLDLSVKQRRLCFKTSNPTCFEYYRLNSAYGLKMEFTKGNLRVRKVVDYAVLNEGESDDSDDNFCSSVNKYSVPTSKNNNKTSKLSKLKLGPRAKSKLPYDDNSCSKKLQLDDVTLPQPTLDSTSSADVDISVPEPDLIIHSILSQETIIISPSCDCPSSQELTDSSEPGSPARSTIELLPKETLHKEIHKLDATQVIQSSVTQIKPLMHQSKKKHDEFTYDLDLNNKVKKKRIEASNEKEQNLEPHSDKMSNNSLLSISSIIPCSIAIEKIAKTPAELSEVSVKTVIPKDGVKAEIRDSQNKARTEGLAGSTTSKNIDSKTVPEKRERGVRKRTPDYVTNGSNNKLTNIKEKKEKLTITPKLEKAAEKPIESYSPINSSQAHAFSDTADEFNKAVADVKPEKILKTDSPSPRRPTTRTQVWNPPGKAGGPNTPLNGNSPAIGLRLGLSRNRRANKPLHPGVKPKM